jgi:hypothetical protein
LGAAIDFNNLTGIVGRRGYGVQFKASFLIIAG